MKIMFIIFLLAAIINTLVCQDDFITFHFNGSVTCGGKPYTKLEYGLYNYDWFGAEYVTLFSYKENKEKGLLNHQFSMRNTSLYYPYNVYFAISRGDCYYWGSGWKYAKYPEEYVSKGLRATKTLQLGNLELNTRYDGKNNFQPIRAG